MTNDARKDVRAAIFSGANRKRELLEVFGTEIELRQPSLGAILDLQELASTKERIARTLINNCFIPKTGEPVFEEGDMDAIMNLPFDENLEKIQTAITKLTGVNIEEEEGNSEEPQQDTTS